MAARVDRLRDRYSVEMWFWNGLSADARAIAPQATCLRGADELAIGGAERATGKLVFASGGRVLEGSTPLATKTWYHVVLVRDGARVSVYLNGSATPEIASDSAPPAISPDLYVGGRADAVATFEGKIDEVAVFGRALSAAEAARHYTTAALPRSGERSATSSTQRPGF